VGVAAGSPPTRARLPENASVHAGSCSARGGACEKRLVLPYKLLDKACLFVTFVVCVVTLDPAVRLWSSHRPSPLLCVVSVWVEGGARAVQRLFLGVAHAKRRHCTRGLIGAFGRNLNSGPRSQMISIYDVFVYFTGHRRKKVNRPAFVVSGCAFCCVELTRFYPTSPALCNQSAHEMPTKSSSPQDV
jgi:hypothetical protein